MNGTEKKVNGFTIMEALVYISILMIVSSITYSFIRQSFQANRFAEEQDTAIKEARKGLDSMVKEFREASTSENGDYPIGNADSQSFTFYGDIDLDEVVEKIQYFLDESDLKKVVTEPSGSPPVYDVANETTTIISKYVRNEATPIFTYYNGDWPGDNVNNPLSSPIDPDTVRLIHIKLFVNYDVTKAPDNFELESNVQIRSLKDNL